MRDTTIPLIGENDVVTGYRLGANSYVSRPVDLAAFSEAVRQLGLCWLIVNNPPPAAGLRVDGDR
jgi:two-component system response regulator